MIIKSIFSKMLLDIIYVYSILLYKLITTHRTLKGAGVFFCIEVYKEDSFRSCNGVYEGHSSCALDPSTL